NVFAINLLLAGAWGALAADYSITSLTIGFVLGFASLWIVRGLFPDDGYFLRVPRLVRLAAVFLRELVLSSIRVARDVLAIRPTARPGIVGVPMRARTEAEILTVSSLVTLTPGTLSLDLSEDGETLYVHAMFVDDPDDLRAEIRETLESPVLEALS
ncbi:MAG: Na+/H+ antiporter subunit E, partial [Pseudomonadota bacterium]